MQGNWRHGLVMVTFVLFGIATAPSAKAVELPGSIRDEEFWRMVTEFSEAGGVFQAEFMSNEDSSQFVIPTLKATTRRGGVYIGVGPEQNFTYIAAIQPGSRSFWIFGETTCSNI